MAATTKQQSPTSILKTSTFTFLQHLHFFIATPSFLAVPYSASVLLSRSLLQTSLLEFQVQPSSYFIKIITLKLFHNIFTVPFSLTFLFAKSSVFTLLKKQSIFRIRIRIRHLVFHLLAITLNSNIQSNLAVFLSRLILHLPFHLCKVIPTL
ncbi:hypothetical protein LINGRAHAP2_LOCUS18225 [Linum grandiflorum]